GGFGRVLDAKRTTRCLAPDGSRHARARMGVRTVGRADGWSTWWSAKSVPCTRFADDQLVATLKEALRMTTTQLPSPVDLSAHRIDPTGRVYRNPSTALLYSHALARGEG